ncbi:hypothetical protein BKA65DRAFT_505300 [Rhexocercosporidium sp. MPI-PUGE-AT-0058]|nr:hypothetical protein BKA65DRAFT_505300 [Rhexocercosporidium sp. MPI-PUGE-AT-0058]
MGCGMSTPKKRGGGGGGVVSQAHALQDYNPVRYQPDQRLIRNPHRIVSRIHFVAHTVLQNGGNHWGIYLQTGNAESVSINMDPSELLGAQSPGHGYRGRMDIVSREYALTRNLVGLVTIPANPGHSVAHFIDAIINAGNHQYDFTTEGRGCTGWILDQYRLFLQLALIPPGHDLERAVGQEWRSVQGRRRPTKAHPVTRGFYMRDTKRGWAGTSGASGASGTKKSKGGRR